MKRLIYISMIFCVAVTVLGCNALYGLYIGDPCYEHSVNTGKQYVYNSLAGQCYRAGSVGDPKYGLLGDSRFSSSAPQLYGPMIGMPPMHAPGMTSQQFIGPGGRQMFCSTTDSGYNGPLTICQ